MYRPIKFASKKLSPAATRWETYDQEGHSLVFMVEQSEYYIQGKHVVLETDACRHRQWLEKSTKPRVVRMCCYLRRFDFTVRHIPGSAIVVADWLSRFWSTRSLLRHPRRGGG